MSYCIKKCKKFAKPKNKTPQIFTGLQYLNPTISTSKNVPRHFQDFLTKDLLYYGNPSTTNYETQCNQT